MRVTIPDNPQVELLGHSRAKLLRSFKVFIDGAALVVPVGFETDYASVPRLPWLYLIAGNTAHRAAIVHDYLYAQGQGRKWADLVFLATMRAEHVGVMRRWLMYAAVRAFGWLHYRGA